MIEKLIFNNLLHNEEYLRSVILHLKEEYFYDNVEKRIFKYINLFFNKYNKVPTAAVLKLALEKDTTLREDEYSSGLEMIESFQNTGEDLNWLLDETEKFCKNKSIYNALHESLAIKENSELPIERQNKKLPDIGMIPELLSNALAVTFDNSVGHDYFEDSEERWKVYHNRETKIPFRLDVLNRITKGGVEFKTLNIILAGVNVGKSLGLCHLAADYISQGYNVLYISMEMSEIVGVAKRIDANLFNMKLGDLENLDPGTYNKRVKRLRENITGKLVIKEYPSTSAHVGHFRALLTELKQKKNFVPQVIMLDYLGECASSTMKYSENSYAYVKRIAQEVRGLAQEQDLCIWTAAQLNRTGFNSSDVDMADTADSFGLPAVADFMLAVIETDEFIAMGQQMFKQIKSRYGNKDINTRFMMGVDKDKQQWFEVTDINNTIPQSPIEQSKAIVQEKPIRKETNVDEWDFNTEE